MTWRGRTDLLNMQVLVFLWFMQRPLFIWTLKPHLHIHTWRSMLWIYYIKPSVIANKCCWSFSNFLNKIKNIQQDRYFTNRDTQEVNVLRTSLTCVNLHFEFNCMKQVKAKTMSFNILKIWIYSNMNSEKCHTSTGLVVVCGAVLCIYWLISQAITHLCPLWWPHIDWW